MSSSPSVLVADIGGTTTRFALAEHTGPLLHTSIVVNDTASSLEVAIDRYFAQIGMRAGAAVLAIAGPISGDEIALTNRPWRFRLSELKARFGFSQARALNDFEALAWALIGARGCETQSVGNIAPVPTGVRIVLGPGTGLGVAALVPLDNGGWQVIASEGGHASFGPVNRNEEAIFNRIADRYGFVSAEMVLSGPGLERLHQAMHPDAPPLKSADIVAQASGGDAAARATVALFVQLLGRFAGDAALMFKAEGGVHVAGGVALGIGTLFDGPSFRTAFEAHPPYEKLLARIPTSLVTCREPGLLGCAAVAQQLAGEDYVI
jgi:glucokinase